MSALPTLRQLRFLVAVTDHLHFGRAAQECLVSQSTLSAAIRELEQLLGVALFERTRHSVRPTAIGRDMAARARVVLKTAEDMANAARAAQDPMAGELQLGFIPTIGPFLLPVVMKRLKAAFPSMMIRLREEQTKGLLARLEAGQMDAAIIALPYPVDDFVAEPLGSDGLHFLCRNDHPLAGRKSLTGAEVAGEPLLLLEDGHCMREHAMSACALRGVPRHAAVQGTSLHTLVHMVDHGLGPTIVPDMAVKAGLLGDLALQAIPLAGEEAQRQIALVWRPRSGRSVTYKRLAEEVRAVL